MNCCCGCAESAHAVTALSVPLVNPNPIYQVPSTPPSMRHPNATYTTQVCGCGCNSFEPLE